MRSIGLHLRLTHSLEEVITKALFFKLKIFQCFFVSKQTGYRLRMDAPEIKKFLAVRYEHFDDLYLHASYWVNLSNDEFDSMHVFKREMNLAKKLSFNYIVLHPGAANDAVHYRLEGIDILAKNLNYIMRKEQSIKIILENTAHGNNSIGSDITDFALLRQKLDHPEKIAFCVDTAHAYSFGYEIKTVQGQKEFMVLLDDAIGLKNIKLIHLNDTQEHLGSKVDKHDIIGKGTIGTAALKSFIGHEAFADAPVILEAARYARC